MNATKQRFFFLAFAVVAMTVVSLTIPMLIVPGVVNGFAPLNAPAQRTSPKFQHAMDHIRRFEGGYANCKHDRGGETKFGICKRSYPKVAIAKLTWSDACDIYFNDFWVNNNLHGVHDRDVAVKLLDMCVNMGAHRSAQITQRAMKKLGCSVSTPGFTPKMIARLNSLQGHKLVKALRTEAKDFYVRLAKRDKSQQIFLKGWLRRASA